MTARADQLWTTACISTGSDVGKLASCPHEDFYPEFIPLKNKACACSFLCTKLMIFFRYTDLSTEKDAFTIYY